MQICFDELHRAQEMSPRPNFLVLLGDRYGWQPLAEIISEAEFEELDKVAGELDAEASRGVGFVGRVRQALRSTLVTQSARFVLRTWYRRDDNADPPLYMLRSRNEPPDSKDYTDNGEHGEWKKIEKALWVVINRAYLPDDLACRFDQILGFDEPLPSIVKFQASATEQEIWRGALAVPDAKEHVLAWYRDVRNRDPVPRR
jgi:hypothetical protein